MFTSQYFESSRDWRAIAVRAHQLLCQIMPDEPADEPVSTEPAEADLRQVA